MKDENKTKIIFNTLMDKEVRILILEDSPADVEIQERELRKAGLVFTSKVVDTREAFLKELDEFSPDIILSDYDLPSFDGLAALRIAQEKCPDVPFIIVTGKLGEEFAIEKLKDGATDYVLKGNLKRLVPAVNRALEEAKLIAERKQAEEALQKAEARYRDLYDNAPDMYHSLDKDGIIIECNETEAKILGYKKEEIIGRPVTDFFTEESKRLFEPGFTKLKEKEVLLNIEREFIRKDGTTFPAMLNVFAVYNKDGEFIGTKTISRDVTIQQQAEKKRQKAFEEQKLLLDNIQTLIWYLKDSETQGIVNKACADFFGKKKEDLENKKMHDIMSKEEVEICIAGNKEVFEKKVTIHTEEWAKNAKGEKRLVAITKTPKIDENGDVEYVVCSAEDITEHKRAEEELRESELRFRNCFDLPLIGFAITSTEKRWIEVNDRICSILGYSRDEIVRKTWSELTHPDDLAIDIEQFNLVLSGQIEKYSIEKRFIRKDGEIVWTSISVGCVRKPDGRVDYVIGLMEDISEHKRADQALRESEERYRKQFEEAIDAIFLADLGTGMLVDCNIAASELVEREKSEIIGKHQSFLHPAVDVKDGFSKTFKSHMAGDASERLEDRVITKSGQIKDVAIRASKITIEGKEVMQGIFRDITERMSAEKELKNLSRQNELILNSAIEGIFGLDVNGNHTFVNSAAAQMLGYRVKELIGRHSHKIWHHSRANGSPYPEEECPIYYVCKYGTIRRVKDEVFWRKDGTSFPVAYTGTPILEGGKLIGAVVTFRDITKRKREEEELRKHRQHLKELVEERTAELKKTNEALQIINSELNAEIQVRERIQQALELSEERYKKMVAAVTSYTYSVQVRKGNAIYTEHSIGCLPITGYNPEDYKSDPHLWHSMIYPDDKMLIENTVKEVMAGNRVLPIEHRIMRRDGATIWIRNTIAPTYNDDDALVRYEGLIENITERKLAEEEIQRLNKELEQKLLELTEAYKELEAFNRSVSHDLQTPLLVIGGFARRYLKVYGDTLDTDEIDMISTIQMSAQKMERLIKDILAFSRSGRQEIKSVQIDMKKLVSAILEELTPLFEGRTINFEIKALSPAYGDISLMKQVWANLISNAIKFTQSKDIALIEVGNSVEENKNIYYVKDNGIGFDSEHTDKLFAPFNRLPEAMQFEGTGIGLSIVERIINRHGGRVWAEGKINDGATFYFSIPDKA